MAMGLLPAAIVGFVLLAGLVSLAALLPGVVDAVTPFADGWPSLWATVIRVTIGTAMVGAALALVAVSFTALTLLVGEPFYERIWRTVERDLGDDDLARAPGFWASVGDGLSLIARGIGVALLAALVGLVPGVGGVLGAVSGVSLTGWLIADELIGRPLSARGLSAADRHALLRGSRARVLGFGVAAQLCFLVPFGAIAMMPAAVAGSTLLAHSLLEAEASARR